MRRVDRTVGLPFGRDTPASYQPGLRKRPQGRRLVPGTLWRRVFPGTTEPSAHRAIAPDKSGSGDHGAGVGSSVSRHQRLPLRPPSRLSSPGRLHLHPDQHHSQRRKTSAHGGRFLLHQKPPGNGIAVPGVSRCSGEHPANCRHVRGGPGIRSDPPAQIPDSRRQ